MAKTTVPTEHDEQKALFDWALLMARMRPELNWLYAVPNAGKRTPRMGAYMKAEGLKAGMLDVVLPVQRAGFGGLYIEMKRSNGVPSDVSAVQREWIDGLRKMGNCVRVAFGWLQAKTLIEDYLDGHVVTG